MEKYEYTKSIADEFIGILHDIYGFFADTTLSYSYFLKALQSEQALTAKQHKITVSELDRATVTYADAPPTDNNAVILHECTQKERKIRNAKNGQNINYVSQFATAMIYEYWENHYRGLFAAALKIEKTS